MMGRLFVRGAALGFLALALGSSIAGAATTETPSPNPPPPTDLTTVRIAKIPVPGNPLRSFDISWSTRQQPTTIWAIDRIPP